MSSDSLYYKHSGHIGLTGPLLMTVVGLLGAVALGTVYGYLVWYNPFIYVNFLATMAYGGLCGAAVSYAAQLAKVRNTKFVLLFGFAVGVFCVYTGWVAWVYALSDGNYFSPTAPDGIFHPVRIIAEDGAWTIFGWTPQGGALYAIWVVEAIMIVGSAVIGVFVLIDESANTFCDSCNKWAEDVYTSPFLTVTEDIENIKEYLEQADYKRLTDLEPAENVAIPGAYARLVIQGCRTCWNFFSLDVKLIELSKDDKGKTEEKEVLLVDNLLIDKNLHDSIEGRFGSAS